MLKPRQKRLKQEITCIDVSYALLLFLKHRHLLSVFSAKLGVFQITGMTARRDEVFKS